MIWAKERPMIFGTWSIPKLQDETKTQTRRTRGLEEVNENPGLWFDPWYDIGTGKWSLCNNKTGDLIHVKCPYGQVGDHIWVRETAKLFISAGYLENNHIVLDYKAGGISRNIFTKDISKTNYYLDAWTPSIFMPRYASRIFLEITGLRLERLQLISVNIKELKAEGIDDMLLPHMTDDFIRLWDSINDKGPPNRAWDKSVDHPYRYGRNPWVWPISFKLSTSVPTDCSITKTEKF